MVYTHLVVKGRMWALGLEPVLSVKPIKFLRAIYFSFSAWAALIFITFYNLFTLYWKLYLWEEFSIKSVFVFYSRRTGVRHEIWMR